MRLISFRSAEGERIGALHADGFVVDLVAASRETGSALPSSMQSFIEAGEDAWASARALVTSAPKSSRRDLAGLDVLAPLPRPIRLRDASLFLDHLEASYAKLGRPMSPEFRRQVIYYNADHLHVFGPNADIPWPSPSEWIDYELEWACVVGRTGSDISVDEASSHIFGYTIFNDWSARDLQIPFMETGLGPCGGKDFANSLGPCIATPDEFGNLCDLQMTARINGEVWSRGTTANMTHRFEDAISQFSRNRVLYAGEVIGSGTVLNGCGFELGRKLAIGDTVELEVEGIGKLVNRVVRAASR